MEKMALLGQDRSRLVDCSEVIPEPPEWRKSAYFPPNTTVRGYRSICLCLSFLVTFLLVLMWNSDAQCSSPFPVLTTQPWSGDLPPVTYVSFHCDLDIAVLISSTIWDQALKSQLNPPLLPAKLSAERVHNGYSSNEDPLSLQVLLAWQKRVLPRMPALIASLV